MGEIRWQKLYCRLSMKVSFVLTACLFNLLVLFVSGQPTERIPEFGSNPGGLRMYMYVPKHLARDSVAPLVVVLHGCLQNAKTVAQQTDWNKLADKYAFRVLYPQQRIWNNPGKCFCWYSRNDTEKDKGEIFSVKQMVEYVQSNYNTDSSRVFVTGLSAGAAMGVALMAVYPEVFNAGAVFAGGPYKAATNIWTGMMAMYGWRVKRPEVWGDYVRAQNAGYRGSYPRMIIYHGKADVVVNRRNATELVKQWTNLHHAATSPTQVIKRFAGCRSIEKRVHTDSMGSEAVVYYRIKAMGHALPVDPGKCETKGGRLKPFSADKNFFSTYWVAVDFGLVPRPVIAGPGHVSKFERGVKFSVPGANARSYSWAVSKGVKITSGQGTDKVTVDWGSEDGYVNVTEIQEGKCRKAYSTLPVNLKSTE